MRRRRLCPASPVNQDLSFSCGVWRYVRSVFADRGLEEGALISRVRVGGLPKSMLFGAIFAAGVFAAGAAVLAPGPAAAQSFAESLGGAAMHSQVSGTVDFREPDDESCIARIRSLVGRLGPRPASPRLI